MKLIAVWFMTRFMISYIYYGNRNYKVRTIVHNLVCQSKNKLKYTFVFILEHFVFCIGSLDDVNVDMIQNP